MALFRSFRRYRKAIGRDEQIVIYPSFASRTADDRGWSLVVQGCVFDPRIPWLRRTPVMGLIKRAMRIDRAADEYFRQRMRQFLMSGLKGRAVAVRVADREFQVAESDYMGLFRGTIELSDSIASEYAMPLENGGRWIDCHAVLGASDTREFRGPIQLVEPTGVSIISDVDDTIKHSNVGNRRDLFRNTFTRTFVPVLGMPELYRDCAVAGTAFHFVSGSPWQLYEPIHDFCRAEGYPFGSFHLKRFRFREAARKLRMSPQKAHKRAAIEPILAAFPNRRFVLIGDSGEQDPEIYGHLTREFPGQVIGIFIRAIRGETRNSERILKAFDGIPPERWTLYTDPTDIRSQVASLVARDAAQA
ncbi:App1 family protein [Schlesneria paludicola]|uniref:App1 family protein n=1 Tax=Schlesneria paludicola TaxID=360056 RepID=UPI0002E9C316|nr:phosphatase domain-containing protein [Schlesneria paludicola]